MILYLDTSAFLKLYVAEAESALVRRNIAACAKAYTHLIAYAEMRAGLAKAVRVGRLLPTDLPVKVAEFEQDWTMARVVAADVAMVRRAGHLAEQFGLRGYDSVHLAAAEAVWRTVPGVDFRVGVFDGALTDAVRALGMRVLEA